MSLFEFLMILLSIIIGLGISELLTGFASILRTGRISQLIIAHWALFLTLLLVLLQAFWEMWPLSDMAKWTFPAMVMMLLSPALLYLATHMIFPESTEVDLSEYYFSKSRIIYGLLTLAALAGVLFRPMAFGSQLLVVENLSTLPTIPVLILLAWSDNRLLHRILVPLCFLTICVDTLVISYLIE